jgi:hypothetical protein
MRALQGTGPDENLEAGDPRITQKNEGEKQRW